MRNIFPTHVILKTKTQNIAMTLAVSLSIVLPILLLYSAYPKSFESTWGGRAPLLIFLWLFMLELFLSWRKLRDTETGGHRLVRSLVSFIVMPVPTIYTLAILYFGLNSRVLELGKLVGVPYTTFGPLLLEIGWVNAFEYIIFSVFFTATVLLVYSRKGLSALSVALLFLGASAFFLTLDTYNPYGRIAILQSFVPLTASSAASVLNFMGYKTVVMPTLDALRGPGTTLVAIAQLPSGKVYFPVAIYWPSAGVHSLFIYTITMLLFIRNSSLALQPGLVKQAVFTRLGSLWRHRMPSSLQTQTARVTGKRVAEFVTGFLRFTPVYVVVIVGAVGTFVANVLRIATISNIGLYVGASAAQHFHDYWGEMFFISWMLLYLALIFFVPRLISKVANVRKKRGFITYASPSFLLPKNSNMSHR